jgi:tetratricopeptide repeat protein
LNPTLLSIIALARSGSLDHAWRLFREAGFDTVDNDPAILAVHGRLLKDEALRAQGVERRRYYLEAAKAYARAGEISGQTYPLINAATLSLLAGKRQQSEMLAHQVLDRREGAEQETPYWRAATKAEAMLLLGDARKAKDALSAAIARAPKAYEDHASTLRQFGLILEEQHKDDDWLDSCRPPRCLHFAGHMSVDGAVIARRIRKLIEEENIGFGYGALAAGADILIAEALLEAGAELHLILPARRAVFREASVAQYGAGWAKKYDRILKSADSVRAVGPGRDPLSPLAIQLAAEVAMGRAVMQADLLMTEAVQLLVLNRDGLSKRPKTGSAWIAANWKKTGRPQHILTAPHAKASKRVPLDESPGCVAALLRLDLGAADPDRLANDILPWLARALAAGPMPLVPPRWTGESVLVAFEEATAAARSALAAIAVLEEPTDMRIACHYAIVQRAKDPFGGGLYLSGQPIALLGQISQSAPAGAIHLTEDFAAALHADSAKHQPRTEYVGELPGETPDDPVRLFSLKP